MLINSYKPDEMISKLYIIVSLGVFNIDIDIENCAYKYILNNAGSAYIYTNSIRGCCGGQKKVQMEPRIVLGSPSEKDINQYQQIEIKDIIIYISNQIDEAVLMNQKISYKKIFGLLNKLYLSDI